VIGVAERVGVAAFCTVEATTLPVAGPVADFDEVVFCVTRIPRVAVLFAPQRAAKDIKKPCEVINKA